MAPIAKTDKITRILTLYHQLLNGQHINKALFSWEHGINERSFDRDIEDLRLFLSEIYSPSEVQFDRDTGTYFLTGDRPIALERMEATIIAKIMLDSKVLREDELHGLYNSLLNTAMSKDATAINRYLQHDAKNYHSNTKTALLKTVGDLYSAIENGVDIQIAVRSDSISEQLTIISPLEIKIKNSVFLLIAAINMDISKVTCYPIEQIDNFTILKTTYARHLQKQYYEKMYNELDESN